MSSSIRRRAASIALCLGLVAGAAPAASPQALRVASAFDPQTTSRSTAPTATRRSSACRRPVAVTPGAEVFVTDADCKPLPPDAQLAVPPPPTSIYSRSDGVVNWQCSIQTEGPMAENIEVHASHVGLGVNAAALYAIGDRLAQTEGVWWPFERSGVRSWIYGRHSSAH